MFCNERLLLTNYSSLVLLGCANDETNPALHSCVFELLEKFTYAFVSKTDLLIVSLISEVISSLFWSVLVSKLSLLVHLSMRLTVLFVIFSGSCFVA